MDILSVDSAAVDSYPNPEEEIEESLTDWVLAGSHGEQRAEAKGEILRCLRNREETLNLARRRLKELPKEVGLLKHLKTLGVSENDLETFPSSILNIKGLQTLNLNAMQRPLSLELMHYVEKLSCHMNFQGTKISLGVFINLSTNSFWHNLLFKDCPDLPEDMQKFRQAFKDSLPEEVIQFAIEPHPEEFGNDEEMDYMEALLEWTELIRQTPAFQNGGEVKEKLIRSFQELLVKGCNDLAYRRAFVDVMKDNLNTHPNGEIVLPDRFAEVYAKEQTIVKMRDSLNAWIEEKPEEKDFRQLVALEMIKVLRTKGTYFSPPYLEGSELTSLPREIGMLSSLTMLSLPDARLSSLPEEIKNLSNLTWLSLIFIKELTEIPDVLFELPSECTINLSSSGLDTEESRQSILERTQREGYTGPTFEFESMSVDDCEYMDYHGEFTNPVASIIAKLSLEMDDDMVMSMLRYADLSREIEDSVILNEEGDATEKIENWIHQLSSVPGFEYDGDNREEFIRAVLGYIDLALKDSDFREAFFRIIDDISDDDQVALSVTRLAIEEVKCTVKNLCEEVGEPSIEINDALLEDRGAQLLRDWIRRLSDIPGFEVKGKNRHGLVKDILRYIKFANNDSDFREVFLNRLDQAGTTCGDRMALSIIHLDIQHTLAKLAKVGRIDLGAFADFLKRGVWIMDLLEMAARSKVARNPEPLDDIEVYLGFPMKLKQDFDLPFNLTEMYFFPSSGITESDLKNTREFVSSLINNEEAFHAFLIKNDRWMATLQERFPEEMAAIEAQREDLIDAERYDEVDQLYIDLTQLVLGIAMEPGEGSSSSHEGGIE